MLDRTSPWHLLQVSDVLDVELASALAESTPVIMWEPERTFFPWMRPASPAEHVQADGDLRRIRFPLMRGYARTGLRWLASSGSSITNMMRAQTEEEEDSPLVCTVPYFAAVAERWKGPVVYWLTDLIAAYANTHGVDIRALDRRMCNRATLVCPNSERLRQYLVEEAGSTRARFRLCQTQHVRPMCSPAFRQVPLRSPSVFVTFRDRSLASSAIWRATWTGC